MALQVIYSNATGTTLDLSTRVSSPSEGLNLPGMSVQQFAEEGKTGTSELIVNDTDSSLTILGHRRLYLVETTAPVGNQVIGYFFIADRTIERGDWVVGPTARTWRTNLTDENTLLERRLFVGSDSSRPAETDVQRIAWLITTTEFSIIGNSTTYIATTGGVAMDAVDYSGQRVIDVLRDCAEASGRDYFVLYREALGEFSLWYNASEVALYDSALRLTNADGEPDEATTWAVESATLNRDPSRVYSGVLMEFNGPDSPVYVQNTATGNTFGRRDAASSSMNVKTLAKATARATRYLSQNNTENDVITASVVLPNTLVTGIKKGQRIQGYFTHLGTPYSGGYVWYRIVSLTTTQITPTDYRLGMEMVPVNDAAIEQFYTRTEGLGCFASAWPAPPGSGNLMISFAAARGGPVLADASTVPIGNTGTPGATCNPAVDVGGTGWSFVAGSAFNISAPGSDFPGYPVALAYRVGVAGEPQTDRWRTSGTQRVHYVEIAGLTGAPTATATLADQNRTSAPGETWTSPDLVSPGAGYWFCGYSSNLRGISDGNGTNGIMTAIAPAVDLTKGYQSGDYSPYSWFGYLKVAGAGTDHVVITRNYGGWIHDDAGWTCAFWPL